MFAGDLLVVSRKGATESCNSQATVYTENKNVTYKCDTHVTGTFLVKKYDNIIINAEYLKDGNHFGDLDQCLEITENDNGQGNISVMCGQSPDIEPTPEITVISAPSPSNPITKFIMAGTIAGGIVILLGIIFVLMPKRKKNRKNDNESDEVDRRHTDSPEEVDRGHTDASEEIYRRDTDAPEKVDRTQTDASEEVNRGHTNASFINNKFHVNDNHKGNVQPEEIQLSSVKSQDHLSHQTETNTKHEVNMNHEVPMKYKQKEQDMCSTQFHAVPNNSDKNAMLNKARLNYAQVCIREVKFEKQNT